MDDLIKALQILRKYGNPTYPTHCKHDVMYVEINSQLVTTADMAALDALGFAPDDHGKGFESTRFGSC